MYNVRDYHAVGTGLVDDTANIFQAIAAMGWKPGTLNFQDGVFLIDSPLFVQPNVTLNFDGACLSLGPHAALTLEIEQAVSVKWFGANGTSASAQGSIAAGSIELNMPGAFFYVGSPIAIYGAGENGGIHYARILTNNGSLLTIDMPAITTVTNAVVKPADCIAFKQALSCHPGSSWFYALEVPKGTYQTHQKIHIPEYTNVTGAGRNNTLINLDPSNQTDAILEVRGGVGLHDLYLNAPGSGRGVTSDIVINDNLYEGLWFGGNLQRGSMLSGTCNNLTVSDCVFENGFNAIQLEGNCWDNFSQIVLYNIQNRMLTTTRGGTGLNITNLFCEAVTTAPGAIGLELTDYKKINLNALNFYGPGLFSKAISLTNCDGIRGGAQFDGFVAHQSDRFVIENCTDVDWND
jgi:hypothetical protein